MKRITLLLVAVVILAGIIALTAPASLHADDSAALDPARRLSEHILDQGEALFRIARSQNSLLSLWSDFQARKPGSGGS
jgi:uncharacterized protein involved in exopolysaccharide biosynthesis